MRHMVAILSAAVATLVVVAAALAGPRAFETTVAPFDPSPHTMPVDFPKRYVETTPFPDGRLDRGGPGGASRQYYEWLKLWLRPWANSRQDLDKDTAMFQETVKEDDIAFKAAIAKLSSDKLAKYSNRRDTQKDLQAYLNARGRETSQQKAIQAAMARSDAALERVNKDEALLSAQVDIEKRASVASDKAAMEKEIAESKAMVEKISGAVGSAVDLMGSIADPVAFGSKTFGIVTGFVLKAAIDDHTMELYVLDLRLEALDKAILAKQKTGAEASLKEARKLVDAATFDFIKAIIDEQLIIEEQNQAIDRLASQETSARKSNETNVTEIFQPLRSIHYDIQTAAKALRRSHARYWSILYHGPARRGAAIYPTLDRLISDVRGYGVENKDEWLNVASESSRYMTKQAAWFPKEEKYVADQMTALHNRVDIIPTDTYVKQILAKF